MMLKCRTCRGTLDAFFYDSDAGKGAVCQCHAFFEAGRRLAGGRQGEYPKVGASCGRVRARAVWPRGIRRCFFCMTVVSLWLCHTRNARRCRRFCPPIRAFVSGFLPRWPVWPCGKYAGNCLKRENIFSNTRGYFIILQCSRAQCVGSSEIYV